MAPRIDPRRTGVRGRRGRAVGVREMRRRFLIVCEGEQTEPAYFRAFPIAGDVVCHVHGTGRSTVRLVEYARQRADVAGPYDEVWVVFDKDDFPREAFHAADLDVRDLDASRPEEWRAAWSNPCFELWYLLHFQLVETRLHRDVVLKRLSEQVGGYRKNDPRVYERLRPFQEAAIRHAERLERGHAVAPHGTTPPADADPCTLVHRLVQRLNAYAA